MKGTRRMMATLLILMMIPGLCFASGVREILFALAEDAKDYTAELNGQMNACLPYGEERLENLNRLLKHLSLRLAHAGPMNCVALLTEGEETLKVIERAEAEKRQVWFSFDPERVWQSENDFFMADGLFDGLRGWERTPEILTGLRAEWLRLNEDIPALGKTLPAIYAEQTKSQAIRTKIRDVGTATQKSVITLTRAQVEEGAMQKLAGQTQNPVLAGLLAETEFSGRQQFTLYLDEGGELLRMLWNGQAGRAGDDRKISLDWKRIRTGERAWDSVTLKMPATVGTNRDVITLEMEELPEGEQPSSLRMELDWQRTLDRVKSALEARIQLSAGAEGNLTGEAELITGTGRTNRRRLLIAPDFTREADETWQGTLRCAVMLDDAAEYDMTLNAALRPGTEIPFPDGLPVETLADGQLTEDMAQSMAARLTQQLMRLPMEDLGFILDELDADSLERIRLAADPSAEGGTEP